MNFNRIYYYRSLRISTPHSDSACSSSAESSDCEGSTHHNFNEAPVEIIPGLFLGNAMHSCDARALQKYNIKVTDIPCLDFYTVIYNNSSILLVYIKCNQGSSKCLWSFGRHTIFANTYYWSLFSRFSDAFSSCHTVHW